MSKTSSVKQHCNASVINRRSLLKGVGGLLSLGGLTMADQLFGNLSPLAYANTPHQPSEDDRHYIFCYFSGGWDILLGLDPRDPRSFGEEQIPLTLIQPGFERQDRTNIDVIHSNAGITFGPFIGELASLSERVTVIRGMSMDTLTHEAGRRRFLTGKAPSGLQARGSSADAWLAGQLGMSQPIPNLSIQVESFNRDLPSYATSLRVSNANDLLRTLTPAEPSLPALVARQLDQSLRDAASCEAAQQSEFLRAAEGGRIKAIEMAQGGFAERFRFNRPEHIAVREHYGFNNLNDSPELRGAIAVEAITSGMSRCVSVQVAGGLDTHFDNWESDQGPNQERGFNVISRMARALEAKEYYNTGRSWLDHTVLVGFSEFSRTPLLNASGGRDHALTNACVLLGGKVRGGQVIGASSDLGMQPQEVDLQTGQALTVPGSGEVVRPEHVLQTLYQEAGIDDRPDLRVQPLETLLNS